ncbi:MAG: TonB C-terminal domain-containing protein [Syntrophales bacterium]|nr:TonB C-terminal domain-containing protein [Syntrophales bacterium]
MTAPTPNLGLLPTLLISLGVHLVVLLGTGLLPMVTSPKLTFGPVYSVRLVSMPAGILQATPSATLAQEVLAAPSPAAVALKKSGEIPKATPITKTQTPTHTAKVDAAVERMRKHVTSLPTTPTVGGSQATTGDDNRMAAYYAAVWSRIKGAWTLPKGIVTGKMGEAIVHARIMRDGSLADVTLEKRSGNATFDASALRAVRKAAPLPPLPAWFSGGSLEVGIRFHADDLP